MPPAEQAAQRPRGGNGSGIRHFDDVVDDLEQESWLDAAAPRVSNDAVAVIAASWLAWIWRVTSGARMGFPSGRLCDAMVGPA